MFGRARRESAACEDQRGSGTGLPASVCVGLHVQGQPQLTVLIENFTEQLSVLMR